MLLQYWLCLRLGYTLQQAPELCHKFNKTDLLYSNITYEWSIYFQNNLVKLNWPMVAGINRLRFNERINQILCSRGVALITTRYDNRLRVERLRQGLLRLYRLAGIRTPLLFNRHIKRIAT